MARIRMMNALILSVYLPLLRYAQTDLCKATIACGNVYVSDEKIIRRQGEPIRLR